MSHTPESYKATENRFLPPGDGECWLDDLLVDHALSLNELAESGLLQKFWQMSTAEINSFRVTLLAIPLLRSGQGTNRFVVKAGARLYLEQLLATIKLVSPSDPSIEHHLGSGQISSEKMASSPSFEKLLTELEHIVGSQCYNGSIENYGPNGVREAPGRSFRYPLTVRTAPGATQKVRTANESESISAEAFRSGYYAFGANQLDIVTGLTLVLKHLQGRYVLWPRGEA